MTRLITTAALAIVLGAAAAAQEPPAAPEAGGDGAPQAGPFLEPGEADVFASRLIGIAVYAPRDAAEAEALEVDGHAIDSARLAEFVDVGQVADVMLTRDGALRAIVVALTAGDVPAGTPQVDPGLQPAGLGPEVAVDAGRVRLLTDATVPALTFAVLAVGVDELRAAPSVERGAMPGDLTGPVASPLDEPAMPGWRMGRGPMTAPGVAMEGFTHVAVAEVSADALTGAEVYGADGEYVGSIGDVVLGASGVAEYAVVDVGGFLGIGTRDVAIGFDEMTILRDAEWNELQVHVAATAATLEALPEHRAVD